MAFSFHLLSWAGNLHPLPMIVEKWIPVWANRSEVISFPSSLTDLNMESLCEVKHRAPQKISSHKLRMESVPLEFLKNWTESQSWDWSESLVYPLYGPQNKEDYGKFCETCCWAPFPEVNVTVRTVPMFLQPVHCVLAFFCCYSHLSLLRFHLQLHIARMRHVQWQILSQQEY